MRTNYRRIIDRPHTRNGKLRSRENRDSRKFKTILDRDFAAMKIVLRMLKRGSIKAFGEIGRQYH